MKIAILGGSGIISSEIVARLVNDHDVTIINRGRRSDFINGKAALIRADMKNEAPESIEAKLGDHYDAVIDFLSYRTEELHKFLNIFLPRVGQYLFISSATVYNTKEGEYSEEDPCGQSEWEYAQDKYACEQLLKQRAEAASVNYTIIRPYITYGKSRIPLQFGPLKYYTIIHRMKNRKCVPLYGENVACTLTTSKDFAVGACGLVGNKEAYNQIFHIVGNYVTTWDNVLKTTADAFDCKADVVRLGDKELMNPMLAKGLDVKEVLCDKGRPMVFDNSKLVNCVPEFVGNTTLEKEMNEIVNYFNEKTARRTVDFAWDGRMDHLLIKSGLISGEQKSRLKFIPSETSTRKDCICYYFHRYQVLYFVAKVWNKAVHMFGRG